MIVKILILIIGLQAISADDGDARQCGSGDDWFFSIYYENELKCVAALIGDKHLLTGKTRFSAGRTTFDKPC
jgi:hypothetical protein